MEYGHAAIRKLRLYRMEYVEYLFSYGTLPRWPSEWRNCVWYANSDNHGLVLAVGLRAARPIGWAATIQANGNYNFSKFVVQQLNALEKYYVQPSH
jgi:hypothetical protein